MTHLYSTLNVEVTNRPLPEKKLTNLVTLLSEVNSRYYEPVILIITEHARLNDEYDVTSDDLPYSVKQIRSDVRIDVKKLPSRLQRILLNFLTRMTEDKNL